MIDSSPSSVAEPRQVRVMVYVKQASPLISRILIGVNLVVFLAMIGIGYLVFGVLDGTEDLRVLLLFGAKVNELIAAGQTWRLFTAMFLHIGVLHLLFNLYALYLFGPQVEGIFGHRRFTVIYVVGGLFGSLASYAFVDNLSAGASGAIFGLVGALSVYYLRYRDQFGAQARAVLQNMAMIVVVNFIFGLSSPGIDNWGHLGGLLGGAVVAWGLIPRYLPPAPVAFTPELMQNPRIPLQEEPRLGMEMGWMVICLGLIWLGVGAVGG
ncbi:MAG: rhomboid family intramembrane serine protease [Caldilineaceae bacterium]|nr:rhomboid family intramembrane serine protease [Caldilineaceae bacterium]MBP8107149.1 rhomboid family intramembrane serine protease [Caldilineaceae bacterium]MBP8121493.1 rhomboid family intramembrane serine protease [Caldilineaceae bacterium]MBP9073863.1 rhomboid family intramembrane serine protease [Caldilineaceae bacterium]